ncbi:MAG: hypothetical protein M0C28_10600 [Candidatus Moduliflexus flocculans]|nr:hypothetical protein [Candidatus Moduliflexus flocculans]
MGINIGSSNVKVAMLQDNKIIWSAVEPHEGNFLRHAQKDTYHPATLPADIKTLATGTEGRHLLNINSVIEPLCIEEALQHLHVPS